MTENDNSLRASESGFTLVEVLIVLILGMILVSAAVPSMSNLIANSRRSSGTTELLIAMNLARSEALKRHRHVTVCKSADGESCGTGDVTWSDGWIVFANDSSLTVNQRDPGEELLLVSPALEADAAIGAESAVENFISFRPSGRAAIAGLYTYCDHRGPEQARGVFVLPSGRAGVSDRTVDGDPLTCGDG